MQHHRARGVGAALAILLTLLLSAPAAAQMPGRITGTAVDAETGGPLIGAAVGIAETNLAAITDSEGRFTFLQVPSGNRTLSLTYVGREPQSASVMVPAGGAAMVNFNVPALPILLGEVDVLTSRMMVQSEALNRQRTAPNIANIVAADQIGRFPDASAPDAVSRIPGVSIARDQGEGRYIQIRGGSAANTVVTFNGVQIPPSEGDVRQIALDAVPVDILESIEVSKAILPDMDADAIGGSVNLVTQGAPASRLFSVETSGGYAPLRSEPAGSGSFLFGDRYADGALGFLLSGSYSRRDFGSDDVEPIWDLGDEGPGDDILEEHELRFYELWRSRVGLNANLDYRFSETSSLSLTGIYTSMTDQEQRHILLSVIEDEELEFAHKNREESQDSYHFALAGERILGSRVLADGNLSWTRSLQDTPFDTEIVFIAEDVGFDPTFSDPAYVRSNPSSLSGPFLFDAIEPARSNTEDTNLTASMNLTIPFGSEGVAGQIRTGFRFRDKTKDQDLFESAWELADGELVLGQDVGGAWNESIRHPNSYPLPPVATTPDDVLSFVGENESALEEEIDLEAETEDYELQEQVVAGYLMAELNLSPRLLILPGIRYEHTSFDGSGFEYDTDTEELTAVTTDRSYGNVFPMVHARYAVNGSTNLRAAFTSAIQRPNIYDLVPYRIRDGDDLVLGNPDLDPVTSYNFDLLFERYDQRVGVISAGIFYKSLSDPIFVFTEDNTDGGETEQARNGESGWIRGAEVALQRQIGGGFGVYGNYTYTDSEAELPTGRTVRLQGQADHVFNAALSFDRGGFSGQASLNFHNDYVEEYADEAYEDVFIGDHLQLDAQASYRLGRTTVFLELVNITNEPLIAYQGIEDRPIQLEYYQLWGRFGVRVNL